MANSWYYSALRYFSTLLAVFVLVLFAAKCVTGASQDPNVNSEIYIVGEPGGDPCPESVVCYKLSYLLQFQYNLIRDNTTIYFLKGTHLFIVSESSFFGWLMVRGVENVTIQGLAEMECGYHKAVMQSPVIIRCPSQDGRGGIQSQFSSVTIRNITFANCSAVDILHSATFLLYGNADIQFVSIQNVSTVNSVYFEGRRIRVRDSSFASANINAMLLFNDQIPTVGTNTQSIVVVRSNFSFGVRPRDTQKLTTMRFCGGLNVFLNGDLPIEVNITDVSAYENEGGNIVFYSSSDNNQTSVLIENVLSANGYLPMDNAGTILYGGGLAITLNFDFAHFRTKLYDLTVRNGVFVNNTAPYGGGIGIVGWDIMPWNMTIFSCTFTGNMAAIKGAGLYFVQMQQEQQFQDPNYPTGLVCDNLTITECWRNGSSSITAMIGAVYIETTNAASFNDLRVNDNAVTGFVNSGSMITITGESSFVNNTGYNGGALAICCGGKIRFGGGSTIQVEKNKAINKGGGVYFDGACSDNVCFFLYEECPYIDFTGNEAGDTGDLLYGGDVQVDCGSCAVFPESNPQDNFKLLSSDARKVCFCDSSGKPQCSNRTLQLSVYPGGSVNISVVLVGQVEGLTDGVIHSVDQQLHETDVFLLPSQCTTLNFTIKGSGSFQRYHLIYLVLTLDLVGVQSGVLINVTIEQCPADLGFNYSTETGLCECVSVLTDVVSCHVPSNTLTSQGTVWIGYEESSQCIIAFNDCPFDYCSEGDITFRLAEPDLQCSNNRSGTLCGGCAENMSLLLGSNACAQCTNNYLALIAVFVLAGPALVAFLFVLNLTVTLGTINGLIFYANIVKLYELFFFKDGPVLFITQFIAWINLDLGIPICFYNGMDAMEKAGLQFAFPVYIIAIPIIALCVCRYSPRFTRLLQERLVSVLATLLLLAFGKVTRAIVHALHFVSLNCCQPSSTCNSTLVWHLDANVDYLNPKHTVLAASALLLLIVFILPYTLFVLFSPLLAQLYKCLERSSCVVLTRSVLYKYTIPLKSSCVVWTGLLLLARVFLTIVVVIFDNQVDTIMALGSVILLLLATIGFAGGVYKVWYLNVLEMFFLLHLLFLTFMQKSDPRSDGVSFANSVASFSVGSVLAVFVMVVLFHAWIYTRFFIRFKKWQGSGDDGDNEVDGNSMLLVSQQAAT